MDVPPGSRHSDMKKSFKRSVRSILTAISKEDVYKAFPSFENHEKENMYNLFILAVKSMHAKIEEEFEDICLKTQVGATLDTVEQLVEEKSIDLLPAQAFDPGEIKGILTKVKRDEIDYLSSLLTKAEQQRDLLKARVESLKRAGEDSDAAADAITKLRSWNSNYEKILNGSNPDSSLFRPKN